MEEIKGFFTPENIKELALKLYEWFSEVLISIFGKIEYNPMRALLTNPWFWIILIALAILLVLFRRR